MLKLKKLYDFETEKTYISKNLNNGDWSYRLVIKVLDLKAYDSTFPETWNVSILAVSPEAVGADKVNQAIDSLGMPEEDIESYKNFPLFEFESLVQYGIYAQLWQESGNNLNQIMKQTHKELDLINMFFGFYMDRPENGIGQDGWSLIAGQDIRDFLNSKV